ncbi:hypothetical protein ACLOJK_004304 [Asimina triloba]
MAEKQLVSFKDLALIRDCYRIPSGIILSVPEPHDSSGSSSKTYLPKRVYVQGLGSDSLRVRDSGASERELLVCKLLQGYVAFAEKDDAKLINNSPDSAPEWKSRFFFARLVLENNSLGVLDRWEERLPEPVSAPMVGLDARQRLALMYLQSTVLRWFPSREALVPPSPGSKRTQERKKCLQKRARLSTEGESVREEGTDLQAIIVLVVVSKALAEPNHARMTGPASVILLEGISIAAKGSNSTELVSAKLDLSLEGLSGPLFLKGAPQVIDIEEGDASLLHKQVAFLKSREAKLLSKCEAARAKVVRLRGVGVIAS